MKVDLSALRTLIEQEIARLERDESRLQQQLQHITAVERIAETSKSRFHIVEHTKEPAGSGDVDSEPSRRWFQKG